MLDDDTAAELAKKTDEFILEFRAGKGHAIDNPGHEEFKAADAEDVARRRSSRVAAKAKPDRNHGRSTPGLQAEDHTAQTTKKITKAMELIAASRIQKAMARVRASSPSRGPSPEPSPPCRRTRTSSIRSPKSGCDQPAAVVIFASDRGLAGAFNSQISARAEQLDRAAAQPGQGGASYFLVGRKARRFLQFRHIKKRGGVEAG